MADYQTAKFFSISLDTKINRLSKDEAGQQITHTNEDGNKDFKLL
jgi:hypothetical protein